MPIKLGNTSIGYLYLGSNRIARAYVGSTKVYDLYNPLNLPPKTIRLKFNEGVTPTFSYGTATQVSSSPNVWDLYYDNSSWNSLLMGYASLIEVLGANTYGVTITNSMFRACSNLSKVALFDTSQVTQTVEMFRDCTSLDNVPLFRTTRTRYMTNMFSGCTSLTRIPLLNTPSGTSMKGMFSGCVNVHSGALDLYTKALQNGASVHIDTFMDCGVNTQSGVSELSQIPKDWGGTKSGAASGSFTADPTYNRSAPYLYFPLWGGSVVVGSTTPRPSYNVITGGMSLYTTQSIASVTNIAVDKSLIVNKQNGFSTSQATYYYPALIQGTPQNTTTGNAISWMMIPSTYTKSLTASQSTGTMSGTISSNTNGKFTYEMGTYSSVDDSNTYMKFAYLVTNHPITSNSDFETSEYGFLKCDYFKETTFYWNISTN